MPISIGFVQFVRMRASSFLRENA